ncbi:hypothetical protein [Sphaerisporangium corydalis]|uniref:Uncharacterized protein n=1 Tax=Sphaerisporangium corydalis TaxID=1441875 RepID=A0ABV9ESQ2_9ACTN|nr:hypothetical protein [Sphaerisporangium corydalis]
MRDAAARTHRADHLRRLRKVTDEQIRGAQHALAGLELELTKEKKDVARLESGVSAMLARLLGVREEHLARERVEVAVARQRVDGHRARLARLEADARAAEAELAGLATAPAEYAGLLAEKERRLIGDGDPRSRELADIGAALDRVTAGELEHRQAHHAGQVAHNAIGGVLHYLDSALGASTWDVFGGGLIADSIEHDRLGSADQAAWGAQRALDVFSRELADVGISARARLPQIDTRWFADVFFDNIITDVIRHDRIERSRAEVVKTAGWVRNMNACVRDRHTALSAERARLLARREGLLSD